MYENMEDIKLIIGTNIVKCRKQIGLTQTELAEKLKKSVRTVQKYENGEIDFSISTLCKIAKTLNIPLLNLLCSFNQENDGSAGVSSEKIKQDAKKQAYLHNCLTEEERLCQIAEGVSELAQAALKLHKVLIESNPTVIRISKKEKELRNETIDCISHPEKIAPAEE